MLSNITEKYILINIVKRSLTKSNENNIKIINKLFYDLFCNEILFESDGLYIHNYCNDCGRYNNLVKTDACDNNHVENSICCTKYVCNSGCKVICSKCKLEHYSDATFDGWHRIINCSCGKLIRFNNFCWYGDFPKKKCDRYCGSGCFDQEYQRILKYKKK